VFFAGFLTEQFIDLFPAYTISARETLVIIYEIFPILMEFSIFAMVWFSYDRSKNNHSLFMGMAFLIIGLIDLGHMLSYPYMPNFITPNSVQKAAVFHSEARLISGILFLASAYIYRDTFPKLINKSVLLNFVIILFFICLVLPLFYLNRLPILYSDSVTPIALIIRQFISSILILYTSYLYIERYQKTGEGYIIPLIYGFIIIIFSDLLYFTYQLPGHLLRVAAYFFMYLALYRSSVELPYEKLAAAEEKLRQAAEEKYRSLVQTANDAIISEDHNDIIISWNRGAQAIFGYTEKEVLGKSLIILMPERYMENHRKGFERLRATGESKYIGKIHEFYGLRKDGTEFPLELSITVWRTEEGIFYTGIIRDITERKQAEEALKQSEEKYHTLIDNIQDGVFIIQDGKIQFANQAFAKVCGYTVEEVTGKDFAELVAPEDLEIVTDRYRRRQEREDVTKEYEFHMIHKDGRTRILVNMNVGLVNYHGRVASMGTVKDITEKKKLESQLLRSQRMESIGTLASGIAHDINNVLTPIMLSQQLLQERLTDKESQRLLNAIERSTQRGANLMKQIQSFAKGAEGERNVLQVAQIVSEIREIAEETFPRSIKIRTDIPKDLWTISGDATQLHQVIMNLCLNARDAMPDGGILSITASNFYIDETYARMNTEAKVGPYIVITVSDTGTGIPPEVMDRIFEPFFTTKEHGKGTGLGLSTSLGIVKGHGGFITVYSEVGRGTAFKVYLPAIITPETLKAQEHQQELPAGHGELILVVDDEDQIREITKKILETHGYKVITADDGKEAIALYLQHREKIKLVLMDMMMPVMDGPASIREIRKTNPEIRIIAVSGLTEKDKLTKVADLANAFLPKPYTTEKLLKTTHEVLSTK
jgi:two-component system cell cycle sensor histidine kinase/response regulator CckA